MLFERGREGTRGREKVPGRGRREQWATRGANIIRQSAQPSDWSAQHLSDASEMPTPLPRIPTRDALLGNARAVAHMAQFQISGSVPKRAEQDGTPNTCFAFAGSQPRGGWQRQRQRRPPSFQTTTTYDQGTRGGAGAAGSVSCRAEQLAAQHNKKTTQVRLSSSTQSRIAHLARRQHLGQVVQPHAAAAQAGAKVDKAHVADRRQRQLLAVPVWGGTCACEAACERPCMSRVWWSWRL